MEFRNLKYSNTSVGRPWPGNNKKRRRALVVIVNLIRLLFDPSDIKILLAPLEAHVECIEEIVVAKKHWYGKVLYDHNIRVKRRPVPKHVQRYFCQSALF